MIPCQTLVEKILSRCIEEGECLIWPGAMASGGKVPCVRYEGETFYVRRVLYEHHAGKPPPNGRGIAVTCGCKRCVRHIKPLTKSQIGRRAGANYGGPAHAARVAAGRRRNVKLSEEGVRDIRASADPKAVLAQRWGVIPEYVTRIQSGKARREHNSPFAGLGARP